MHRTILTLVLASGLGLPGWGSFTSAQEGRSDRKDDPPPSPDKLQRREDEEIRDRVKDLLRPVETERDRFRKELQKVPTPRTPGGPSSEFDSWFDRLSSGQNLWRRDTTPKNTRELFDRVAGGLGVKSGQITRAEFLGYAERSLREGRSPPWKTDDPNKDADKTFLKLDRDGDGVLGVDEMPPALQDLRNAHDGNRDGKIDGSEYRLYFQERTRWQLEQTSPGVEPKRKESSPREPDRSPRQPPAPPVPSRTPMPSPAPPRVEPGSERLPPGLPAWFFVLDTDEDDQVGVYEWKAADLAVMFFVALDHNGDGLLTAEETLDYLGDQDTSLTLRTDLERALADLVEKTRKQTTGAAKSHSGK